MAMSAKSIGRFLETWKENGMGDFLRSVGKASQQDVDQIFSNAINADIKEFQEGTGRLWQRDAFVNHGANFGDMISNKTTEEWLNFSRGAGLFDNADGVYETLTKLKGLTPLSKEEARLRFSNAGSRITPEQLAEKNGFSISNDGSLKTTRSAETTPAREGALSYDDVQKANKEFYRKENALAIGERQAKKLKEATETYANPFSDRASAMRIARENNIDINTLEGRQFIADAMEGKTGQQLWAAKQQAALGTGSGKPLQEGTVSIPWTDAEKQTGIRSLREQPGGMPVENSPLYDKETLLAKMGGNKKNFGYDNASKYRLKQVEQKLNDDYNTIIKNGGTFNEQQAAWKKTQDEATKMLEEGPDLADYAFGNNLHYKGLGFAAMVGLTGVAFGGAKSNAQLYSSPF